VTIKTAAVFSERCSHDRQDNGEQEEGLQRADEGTKMVVNYHGANRGCTQGFVGVDVNQ